MLSFLPVLICVFLINMSKGMTWLVDRNTSFICSRVAEKRRPSVTLLLKVCVISTFSVLRLKNLNLSRGAEC